jgi:hypothetical protein
MPSWWAPRGRGIAAGWAVGATLASGYAHWHRGTGARLGAQHLANRPGLLLGDNNQSTPVGTMLGANIRRGPHVGLSGARPWTCRSGRPCAAWGSGSTWSGARRCDARRPGRAAVRPLSRASCAKASHLAARAQHSSSAAARHAAAAAAAEGPCRAARRPPASGRRPHADKLALMPLRPAAHKAGPCTRRPPPPGSGVARHQRRPRAYPPSVGGPPSALQRCQRDSTPMGLAPGPGRGPTAARQLPG